MPLLILGLVLFLGIHSVSIVSASGRNRLVQQMGEGPWKGLYSLVSLAGFALIVVGYGAARDAPCERPCHAVPCVHRRERL